LYSRSEKNITATGARAVPSQQQQQQIQLLLNARRLFTDSCLVAGNNTI